MTVQEWLSWVEKNRARVTQYQLGMDGTDGLCDCVGLIIGAVRLSGGKWTGTHGSNYAARNRMQSLHATAEGVSLGEIVYKAYEPGTSGWDLPATYAGHSDQRDYYHVGVVTSTDPLVITHCTSVSGGIKKDTALGQWKWAGYLDAVDAAEETDMDETNARVIIPDGRSGTTVNMRKRADITSPVVCAVPHGTQVQVSAELDEWYGIAYNGKTGWMMKDFIQMEETEEVSEDKLALVKQKAQELIAALEEAGV